MANKKVTFFFFFLLPVSGPSLQVPDALHNLLHRLIYFPWGLCLGNVTCCSLDNDLNICSHLYYLYSEGTVDHIYGISVPVFP